MPSTFDNFLPIIRPFLTRRYQFNGSFTKFLPNSYGFINFNLHLLRAYWLVVSSSLSVSLFFRFKGWTTFYVSQSLVSLIYYECLCINGIKNALRIRRERERKFRWAVLRSFLSLYTYFFNLIMRLFFLSLYHLMSRTNIHKILIRMPYHKVKFSLYPSLKRAHERVRKRWGKGKFGQFFLKCYWCCLLTLNIFMCECVYML